MSNQLCIVLDFGGQYNQLEESVSAAFTARSRDLTLLSASLKR